jgi:hypothetical protein
LYKEQLIFFNLKKNLNKNLSRFWKCLGLDGPYFLSFRQ